MKVPLKTADFVSRQGAEERGTGAYIRVREASEVARNAAAEQKTRFEGCL
jgi:hypothetical protein